MRKNRVVLLMLVFCFTAFCAVLSAEETMPISYPLGVDASVLQVPEDNPISIEKIELGKALYFDPRLSKDGTISCASCHNPQKGYTDQQQFSDGIHGQKGGRNSPTVLNSSFSYFQFWDGRAADLEAQAVGPMENPVEMGHTLEGATAAVRAIDGYKPLFRAAFGDDQVTIERIAKAIATFERSVVSGNSAWDRYVYESDETALSESAKRGLKLFEGDALCTRCHVGFTLSDSLFHNLGVGMNNAKPDMGRYDVTKEEKDKGAFKTPTLRDLQRTAPYMHDGSVGTLEEVIDLYDRGGEKNPWLDPKMEPLHLTAEQKADLLAFLRSLEGDWKPVEAPSLPE